MIEVVEEPADVGIDDPPSPPLQLPPNVLARLQRRAVRSEAVGAVGEVGLEDRLDHQLGGRLHDPVTHGRDAKRALPARPLGDHHAPNRQGPIAFRRQLRLEPVQEGLDALGLDGFDARRIHAGSTAVSWPRPATLSLGCPCDGPCRRARGTVARDSAWPRGKACAEAAVSGRSDPADVVSPCGHSGPGPSRRRR